MSGTKASLSLGSLPLPEGGGGSLGLAIPPEQVTPTPGKSGQEHEDADDRDSAHHGLLGGDYVSLELWPWGVPLAESSGELPLDSHDRETIRLELHRRRAVRAQLLPLAD